MIPAAYFELQAKRIANDRATADLRSYLRSEWGLELHGLNRLLVRPGRPESVPRFKGIRRWWARRRAAREPEPIQDGPAVAASPSAVDDCAHPDLEPLGLAGTAAFLQCVVCGGVLVASGGRRYSIGAPERPGTR